MPRDVRAPSGAQIRQDGKDAPMILLGRLEFELHEDATHMTFNGLSLKCNAEPIAELDRRSAISFKTSRSRSVRPVTRSRPRRLTRLVEPRR